MDVENPDVEQFPLFATAPYFECILQAGEMLYIPPKVCDIGWINDIVVVALRQIFERQFLRKFLVAVKLVW